MTVGTLAAAPAWLVVVLVVLVVALVGVVLLADRPAERAVLLIAAIRGKGGVLRLDRTATRESLDPARTLFADQERGDLGAAGRGGECDQE